MTTEFYKNRKKTLIGLIKHYETKCLGYLDYAAVNHMSLNDLEQLYNYDFNKQEFYEGELALLEAEMLLAYRWEAYLKRCIKLN
jgi:hypothetical protein